ncbi:MAG: PEP-CTERM sorting domain-containing protein [Myxococcota bacterium]
MTGARFLAASLALAAAGGPSSPAHAGFDDPGLLPSEMVAWATGVDETVRGPQDIANPTGPLASLGMPVMALGPAAFDNMDVVSLGDGGHITVTFDEPIVDLEGDDFAVFENGFFSGPGLFAEFAFIEVSSDGVSFARFPSETLNMTPVPSFAVIDPFDYDFAGDQPLGLGTGFDLADLAGDPLVVAGTVDLFDVAFVRVVDVVGNGSTVDAFGAPVYDPYPTAFPSGGFDLDAVGVVHPLPEPGAATGLAASGLVLLVLHGRRRIRGC